MDEKKELITVVVQRKDADRALDAALKAGAPGATFFYARGTGVRQRLGLLGMLIEEEKQVILIVVPQGHATAVLAALQKAVHLDEPGRGFAFVQTVDRVVGFYDGKGDSP